jgi:tetratricopeptide (TPR) repeat protein
LGRPSTGQVTALVAASLAAAGVSIGVAQVELSGEPQKDIWANPWLVLAVALTAAGLAVAMIYFVVSVISTSRQDAPTVSPDAEVRSEQTLLLRNPTFTGRTALMEDLANRLEAGPVAVVALRGIGGIGKSQLALEFAYRQLESGRYHLAAWVRADSPVTIAEDLAALAPLVGISGVSEDEIVSETAERVVNTLRHLRDWIVVFDNAQTLADIAGHIPSGNGHVLITSRRRIWSGVAAQIDLGEFSPAESVEFLNKRAGRKEVEAATDLAYALGYLPLALAQAAAYIDTRSIMVADYLEKYRDPVLARELRDDGLDSAEYPASVARTWRLTFSHLSAEHPAAIELLRLCAFLDPDDIDLSLFRACASEAGEVLGGVLSSAVKRSEAVGALGAVSFVNFTAEGHLRIHRLIQAVTRDQLTADQAAEWAARALSIVGAVLPNNASDYRSWHTYALLAPHVQSIMQHTQNCSVLGSRSIVLRNVGIYLGRTGQLDASRAMFERLIRVDETYYGIDHPETGRDLGNLAATQIAMGRVEDSRPNRERALAIFESAYGKTHPETGKVLGNLTVALRRMGDYRGAEDSAQRALEIFEVANGAKHADVATALDNLARVQLRLMKLREARANAERAVSINREVFGHDYPAVAGSLAILAAVQMRQWRPLPAFLNYYRAVSIVRDAYGDNGDLLTRELLSLEVIRRGRIATYLLRRQGRRLGLTSKPRSPQVSASRDPDTDGTMQESGPSLRDMP